MAKKRQNKKVSVPVSTAPLKLDFGCGPNKKEGFLGVDILDFPGVDKVVDLRSSPWPFEDNSVEEAYTSHFVEHLTADERVTFVNELYRILKPGASCQIIVPHWASGRAYGDPTHMWPPVSEWWFFYLSQEWRNGNAPHTDIKFNPKGFNCNFVATWGYALRADLQTRNAEYQQNAIANWKEACTDTYATLTKPAEIPKA
jgi:SAM-dependent methyltransferase